MSRGWSRGGRGQGVAVPLDTLFKESANRPSASRSAGTVGKWGITSFTSIRNTAYGLNPGGKISSYVNPKRPRIEQQITSNTHQPSADPFSFDTTNANDSIQNTNTDNIQHAPKPKKFFKSRNATPVESSLKGEKVPKHKQKLESSKHDIDNKNFTKKSIVTTSKQDIPKLKICLDKTKSTTKYISKTYKSETLEKVDTLLSEKTHLSPNKRYLSRNRDKIVNYSERNSLSPPPATVAPMQPPVPVLATTLMSPQRSTSDHPPIVLRISKGTSRLISTDSESGNNSPPAVPTPGSPRTADLIATLSSSPPRPPQESLKLTIRTTNSKELKTYPNRTERSHKVSKCDSNFSKSGGESSRAARASRRNQQKDQTEQYVEPTVIVLKRGNSPQPGSENYDLYRTLASPSESCANIDTAEAESTDSIPLNSNAPENDSTITTSHQPLDDIMPNNLYESPNNELYSDLASPVDSHIDETNSVFTNYTAADSNTNIDNDDEPDHVESTVPSLRLTRNNSNGSINIQTVKPSRSYSRKRKNVDRDTNFDHDAKIPNVTTSTIEEMQEPQTSNIFEDPVSDEQIETVSQSASDLAEKQDMVESFLDKQNMYQTQWSDDNSESSQEKSSEKIKLNDSLEAKETELESCTSDVVNDSETIEKPIVKLVISKKKGSIFKSRALMSDGQATSSKKRHVYRHKCWLFDEQQKSSPAVEEKKTSDSYHFDDFDDKDSGLVRVARVDPAVDSSEEADTITSVLCSKEAKGYYTVVRNVKKAHQIQEIGEAQELNDDVEYILDALQDNNPMSTRCLSAIKLASKCMTPAFRMHVRAHNTVTKFFRALHDAAKDQSLGLCTATVMFVLSQDQLNMDVDRDSLELMLNLLESDASHQHALDDCGLSLAQLHKNKQKVRELCEEIKSQGKAVHLNLENITVGQLAMETLLSLTSKRAGEWFKEELRELGGIEHIVKTICDCCRQVTDYVTEWTDILLDKLRKVERCLRVLENVTQLNEENQSYLLKYNNGQVVDTLVHLYQLCDREIPLYPTTNEDKEGTGVVIRETLMPTLKVLINLTHSFSKSAIGSIQVGAEPGVVETSLHLLLQAPNYIPHQKNFELSILALLLMINLVQYSTQNRITLMTAKAPADHESIYPNDKSAIQALTEYFYQREQLARQEEQTTDNILDGKKDGVEEVKKPKSHEEFIEETVTKLLQKAGTHMEHTMVASYVVLLLGYTITDSPESEESLTSLLPDRSYFTMIQVLSKYYKFMNLTASGEASIVNHIKQTGAVLKYLEDLEKTLQTPPALDNSALEINDISMLSDPMTENDINDTSDLSDELSHLNHSFDLNMC